MTTAGPSRAGADAQAHSDSGSDSDGRSGFVDSKSKALYGGTESEYESADEEEDEASVSPAGSSTHLRRSKGKGVAASFHPQPHTNSSSRNAAPSSKSGSAFSLAELDLSIMIALASPIGSWLTGGDHVKNLLLVVFLIFYLHQLIEAPWRLYLASLPRTPASSHSHSDSNDFDYDHQTSSSGQPTPQEDTPVALAARTALRRQELFLLLLTLLSPALGALFLQRVLAALGDGASLSWFSMTLFVLATGVRPLRHLVLRISARTHALHDAVHYPPSARGAERLEGAFDGLRAALGALEQAARKGERRGEAARLALAARLAALERGTRSCSAGAGGGSSARSTTRPPARARTRRRTIWGWCWTRGRASRSSCLPSSAGRTRYGPSARGPIRTLSRLHSLPSRSARAAHAHAHENGTGSGQGKPSSPPHLPTIPEGHSDDDGDSAESDGTYVSEKDQAASHPGALLSPAAAAAGAGEMRRKRSGSGGGEARQERYGYDECARSVVLWPYRASVRTLSVLVPPLKEYLPGVGA
ncbi:hypothetical protein WOLCODRAFT_144277 [Wolfiporia cocos MD-104 SS10]|uniref:Uncharacterized protein n=1 Tax=Wolfiporia cocos (strain MD-104) TaxID=742152 RepID=A0A2H3K1M0_WOLCO|nr:hypothetical protein WOLCODRAFT_144277 [Wolfiporia cocos MD-104 SS10]